MSSNEGGGSTPSPGTPDLGPPLVHPGPSAIIVFVAVLASLLEIIDTSIVNVAIPTMMGNLGATLEDISMVITGYAIANAIVLPLSSWLGERIGRRKYYLSCIALFTITSVACGFAPNLETLIVFRILQGLAGGALLPTSQTLIYEQFPKEKAGMAGAIFGMSVMIGPTLGPVLGGYLTDHFGWRMIFNVNLPLGLLALTLGARAIQNRAGAVKSTEKGFDALGLILLTAGIGCLQFMLERGEADDWFSSAAIVSCAIVTALSIPGFVLWELRTKNPVIDVRLFLNPIVRSGVLLMMCLGFFLYGVVFVLPVFVGRVFHYDATQTGALFIPGSILTAMMMPFIGQMLQRGVNPKLMIAIGFLAVEVCVVLMTCLSTLSSRGEILQLLMVRGFAMAFLFVPINSSILSQFSGVQLGQVSGMMNLFRQIGGSIGIAVVGTLLSTFQFQYKADLAAHVTPLRPAAQQAFQQFTHVMPAKLPETVGVLQSPSEAATSILRSRVETQAFMLGFIRTMWVLFLTVGLGFIPLSTLKISMKRMKPVTDSH